MAASWAKRVANFSTKLKVWVMMTTTYLAVASIGFLLRSTSMSQVWVLGQWSSRGNVERSNTSFLRRGISSNALKAFPAILSLLIGVGIDGVPEKNPLPCIVVS